MKIYKMRQIVVYVLTMIVVPAVSYGLSREYDADHTEIRGNGHKYRKYGVTYREKGSEFHNILITKKNGDEVIVDSFVITINIPKRGDYEQKHIRILVSGSSFYAKFEEIEWIEISRKPTKTGSKMIYVLKLIDKDEFECDVPTYWRISKLNGITYIDEIEEFGSFRCAISHVSKISFIHEDR